VVRADDTLVQPGGVTPAGIPIYERADYGFSLVVEARPGGSLAKVGSSTFNYNPSDPTVLPDLQVEVSQPLGNGSTAVCDSSGTTAGGVPAINPPDFSPLPSVAAAINDLTCRFLDGAGTPAGRGADDACVALSNGGFGFVAMDSTIQFCGAVDKPIAFPVGDTVITARVRDLLGYLSQPAQIVLRVAPP